MNKLKILIIEDEIITATDLKETLEKYNYQVIGIAKNHSEAFHLLDISLPDIILIDIQLKNSIYDGIDIAGIIKNNYRIPCVFLTANAEILTFKRAQESEPAAYLLKPYRHKELAFQIELAYQHYQSNLPTENNPLRAGNIYLPLEKGHQRIAKEEVVALKAEGSYVNVFTKNIRKPYLFSMNIGYLNQYFTTTNFYQVSRSFVVNLNYIERFDADFIYMNHYEEKIPIPQNRKQEFLKRIAVIRTP